MPQCFRLFFSAEIRNCRFDDGKLWWIELRCDKHIRALLKENVMIERRGEFPSSFLHLGRAWISMALWKHWTITKTICLCISQHKCHFFTPFSIHDCFSCRFFSLRKQTTKRNRTICLSIVRFICLYSFKSIGIEIRLLAYFYDVIQIGI